MNATRSAELTTILALIDRVDSLTNDVLTETKTQGEILATLKTHGQMLGEILRELTREPDGGESQLETLLRELTRQCAEHTAGLQRIEALLTQSLRQTA